MTFKNRFCKIFQHVTTESCHLLLICFFEVFNKIKNRENESGENLIMAFDLRHTVPISATPKIHFNLLFCHFYYPELYNKITEKYKHLTKCNMNNLPDADFYLIFFYIIIFIEGHSSGSFGGRHLRGHSEELI